ncbi:unnamed protein product, partial [Closterium sp. NIES-53]
GCSPSPLLPSVATAAAVDFLCTVLRQLLVGGAATARARGVRVVGGALEGVVAGVVVVVGVGVEAVVVAGVEAVVAAVEVAGVVEAVEWVEGARVAVVVELAGAEAMGRRLVVQLVVAEALGVDSSSSHAPPMSFVMGGSAWLHWGQCSLLVRPAHGSQDW